MKDQQALVSKSLKKCSAKLLFYYDKTAQYSCSILVLSAPSSLAARLNPDPLCILKKSVPQAYSYFAEYYVFYDNWTAYCL